MLFVLTSGAVAAGCAPLSPRPELKPTNEANRSAGFRTGAAPVSEAKPAPPLELILCGADEVFILSLDPNLAVEPRKIWSWRAAECLDLPVARWRAFGTTDDCKPVAGGKQILISSSSGAVALVERETRKMLFHATVPAAHSIEMLPNGRIAVAAASTEEPGANRIVLFDVTSGRELASDKLVAAHGVVWDESRIRLWALASGVLRAYTLTEGPDQPPRLKVEFETRLPEADGHDLSPVPGSPRLFVSTAKHCWYFDRDTRQFAPHDLLADRRYVKCCSVHPATGRIAFIQSEGTDWWAERVHLLNPEGVLRLPGQRLYKARWA